MYGMPALTTQTETRCRVLGVDAHNVEHIHDPDRDRIVALDDRGIEVQVDLKTIPGTLGDWMQYVAARRGWDTEQWVGYRWANALNDAQRVVE